MTKQTQKSKTANHSTLAKEYGRILEHISVPLPAPVYRESLEQPYPYPPVETITTYGVSIELNKGV